MKHNFREKNPQRISGFLTVAPWGSGYHYCTTSFNKAWTQVLYRFKSCSWHVGDLRWWVSLTMVLAGNTTKCLLPFNHTTKQFIIIIIIIILDFTGWPYFDLFELKLLFSLQKQCWSMFLSKFLQDSLERTAGQVVMLGWVLDIHVLLKNHTFPGDPWAFLTSPYHFRIICYWLLFKIKCLECFSKHTISFYEVFLFMG